MRTLRFPTKTLFNIYPNLTAFKDDITELGNSEISAMSNDQIANLYMYIAAKYGDSNIRYTNEYLFKLNLFKEINSKWPKVLAWQRDQKTLRDTDIEQFKIGARMIQNTGAHNTSNIDMDTLEGIDQLDAQTITNSQRGELGVLQERISAYRTGEEDKFVNSLAPLFIVIIAPMHDLLYGTLPEEEDL